MNQKCPKCGKVLLTINAFIQEWEADPEPYEADAEQEHEGISHDLSISSEYCEKCQDFTYIWTDPEPVIKTPEQWTLVKDEKPPVGDVLVHRDRMFAGFPDKQTIILEIRESWTKEQIFEMWDYWKPLNPPAKK